MRRRRDRAGPRGARAPAAAGGAPVARARASRGGLHPAGLRPLLRRSRARGAGGGGAGGHREPGRGLVHQPGRVDQQGGDLVDSKPCAAGRAGCFGLRRTAATGSPTTRRRWCAGTSRPPAGTWSWGSRRPTWSACSPSSGSRGAATASRCCRSGRSTTRSWDGRWSPGRSASTRAASRSWWARRQASPWRPRAAPISPSSRRPSASASPAARPGSRPSARTWSGRCSRRCRGWAGPGASPPTSACPPARSISRRPATASAASTSWPAGTSSARPAVGRG